MFSDIVGLVVSIAPVVGLLVWREHADRRDHAAGLVRADIHAGVSQALDGDSVVAIQVEGPTAWRPGRVRLSTPSGYESLIGVASRAALERLPSGYHVMIDCGGGS
jgi:hypothetical protein